MEICKGYKTKAATAQRERERTTLSRDHPALSQRPVQQLEIRLLEQRLRWPFRIAAVRDYDIEFLLVPLQELEPVPNMDCGVRVLEPNRHARQILLREPDDGLVNVTEDGGLHGRVLDDLAEDAAVAAADDEDFAGIGVRVHGEVGDHFLVTGSGVKSAIVGPLLAIHVAIRVQAASAKLIRRGT